MFDNWVLGLLGRFLLLLLVLACLPACLLLLLLLQLSRFRLFCSRGGCGRFNGTAVLLVVARGGAGDPAWLRLFTLRRGAWAPPLVAWLLARLLLRLLRAWQWLWRVLVYFLLALLTAYLLLCFWRLRLWQCDLLSSAILVCKTCRWLRNRLFLLLILRSLSLSCRLLIRLMMRRWLRWSSNLLLSSIFLVVIFVTSTVSMLLFLFTFAFALDWIYCIVRDSIR